MKNEIERLMRDRNIPTQSKQKTLTENLKQWRHVRNIKNSNIEVFIENILEELLEICYDDKEMINEAAKEMMETYFDFSYVQSEDAITDAIQDIQVFCINETELMGYDNIKCNNEVFKHINCRKQDPIQYIEWKEKGPCGKWQKDKNQDSKEIYEPDYASCKCSK